MNYTCDYSVLDSMAWLSDARKQHIISTANTAKKLAAIFDDSLIEKAFVAGLYHDCAKGVEKDLLPKYDATEFNSYFSTLHAPLGAYFARDHFGINDADIFNAIYWHCTGRPNMSSLEKIVFIADAIEPFREYEGVEGLRELTFTDLDKGILAYLQNLLAHLKKQMKPINPYTIKCYEFYRGLYDQKISK